LGQKSLRRKELTAILITLKNRPHFGTRAEIGRKKPWETRRKQGFEKIRSGTFTLDTRKTGVFLVILEGF
jgi:hypothetical protein